jgi:glucose/arabinose dehydrogenase
MRTIIRCAAAAALGIAALAATAQQQQQNAQGAAAPQQQQRAPAAAAPQQGQQRAAAAGGGIPRPPNGIVVPPLGAGPFTYKTAEQEIRVVVHTRGLTRPWSLVWLPNGEMLVTERTGALRVVRNGVLDPQPVAGVPEVRVQGLSGLFDVALHPQFATNKFVYLTYNKPIAERQNGLGVARGTWDGKALTNVKDIFVTTDASSVSRLVFGRDGKLYVSTFGNAGDGSAAQNPMSHAGKVLRLNDDGTTPSDNPFSGSRGLQARDLHARSSQHARAHRASRHRRAVGERERPERRRRGQHPEGRRELRLAAGQHGPLVSGAFPVEGLSRRKASRIRTSIGCPSIAASGFTIYTGDKLPGWKNNLLIGGMRMGEIPGTGHLERVVFNANWDEIRREMLLVDLRQRIRDVRQGPDQLLYALTDEDAGAILRIEPAN